MENTDILIIGGGIAGLTLAALLGKVGIRVHLADPHAPPALKDVKPSGRTVALMESSLNIIKATGVWGLIEDQAGPMKAMRIIDDNAAANIDIDFPAQDIGLEQFGFNVPNSVLRSALFEIVRGIKNVTLHVPATLESYDVQQSAVISKLSNGIEVQSSLIVGADGRKSFVREAAGIDVWTHEYGQSAITCLINHSRAHNFTATEFHRPSGPLALVPMPGNQSSVVWVEHTDRAQELIALKKEEFTLALQDRTQGLLGALNLETGPECWPLIAIKSKKLTAPRTALMAEAAHVMSPITAQGLNLSLRDVAALAEIITDTMRVGLDPGSDTTLNSYAKRRRIDVNSRVLGVDVMNRIVSTDAMFAQGFRRAGLKTLDKFMPLKKFAMQAGLAPQLDLGRLAKGEKL